MNYLDENGLIRLWAHVNAKNTFSGDYNDLINKPVIPDQTSDLKNDSGFITKIVEDLENYYLKSETYTKEEINQRISTIPKFEISVVSSLPTNNISKSTIYLLSSGEGSDLYTEYIYVNNIWEILGSQRVDLTGYATETWVSGQLNDYALKSELPTRLSQLSGDSTHRVVTDTERDAWNAKSNFSGNYNDLTNKPTIPTVPVQSVNGKTGAVQLTASDVGAQPAGTYLTFETDPTVPAWAKASSKPSYTKSEIGLANVDNVKQYSASNPPPYPVTKVNGKTGDVSLTASDVGAQPAGNYALKSEIPSVPVLSVNGKIGEVSLSAADIKARPDTWMPTASDVGADSTGTAINVVEQHNQNTSSHADIRNAINNFSNRLDEIGTQEDIAQEVISILGTPITNEPYKHLVTNENGEQEWVERTHYVKSETNYIIQDASLVYMSEGLYIISDPVVYKPVAGNTYTVNMYDNQGNNISTDLTAFLDDSSGLSLVCIGNPMFVGGEDNEYSFLFGFVPDDMIEAVGGQIIVNTIYTDDISHDYMFSIEGTIEKIKQIDKKYLPEIGASYLVNGSSLYSVRSVRSDEEDEDYKIGTGAIAFGGRASGDFSLTQGESVAEGNSAVAFGTSEAIGDYSFAIGTSTIADSNEQFVFGKRNISDNSNEYSLIVGNGDNSARSNAHTLDWDGNAWFSGDVYVGSTSGVDRDEGSKKLATEDYVDEIKATSSTVINIIEKYNIDLDHVYDTNFDLATYVNQAIQEATEEGKFTSGDTLYLPPAKYRVLTPIIVNKSVNLKFEGSLEYQGTDFAIEFSNYSYCTADINRIRALNGSCIKILSDSTLGHGPIIYNTFKFNRLSSNSDTGYCFYAEIKGVGYIGQNKFVGGQCGGGFCAFKINNIDSYADGFGGNLFESMAVEGGFKEGFHFTDWCVNNTLFNCNLEESGDGYIKGIITEGYNSGLKVIGSSNFYRSYMDLSDTTDGMVIGSMRDSNAKLIDSYAYIVRGDFVLEKHDRTKDLADVVGIYDMANVVVDYNDTEYRPNYSEIGLLQYNNEYTEFLTGNQCNGIILSKKYGHINGINEFSVVFQRDNIGTFVIKNYLSEEISYEVPQIAGVTVRFKWVCEQNDEYGGEWKYSYEFADVSKMRDFLTSKDDVASYHSVLNTITGGVTTDAVGGRAASVTTSFAPNGVFTELNTLTLDVNGNKYTTDLPANVYQGTYDWVTGEISSTATKILAKDKCQITESGVNSSGINYILIDGEGINFLELIASNRYIRKDEHPYVDKSIRAKNNGDAYLYDSAIDLNNPAAILEGLELLFPSESVTVTAHPKTITLNPGANTITTENGEVLEMTYGIDAKTYINNQIQTYVNEAILGGAW